MKYLAAGMAERTIGDEDGDIHGHYQCGELPCTVAANFARNCLSSYRSLVGIYLPMSIANDCGAAMSPSPYPARDTMSVAVVITTYNHARFLGDAIESVLKQTRTADEIIVVDDGSTDDPAAVVARFPGVQLIRQKNLGLSAARNVGLRSCTTSYLVFLDADDRLLPGALERGLAFAHLRPDCAFVYGGHRWISEDGEPEIKIRFNDIGDDAHLAFLCGNPIGMHATILYQRDCLLAEGGFDEGAMYCEDHDLFLRLTRKYPIASYPALVAEYRQHEQNKSSNAVEMLRNVLAVLDRHEARIGANSCERAALQRGRAHYRDHYTWKMLEAARAGGISATSLKLLIRAIGSSPITVVKTTLRFVRRRITRAFPPSFFRQIERLLGRPERFPLGSARFGDLGHASPISPVFGFDRRTPVDRYYIYRFLSENSGDIRGRVLETCDNFYTLRIGGVRVERSDVLHVDATNPCATIVGDLTDPAVLPEGGFDCIVLTQTLHYLFDMRAGVAMLNRALKPGGVLLLTMPGISGVDVGGWGSILAWSVTTPAVRQLLEERFRSDAVAVKAHGNVFAATAFLRGLAVEELDATKLDVDDPRFPIVVVARAVKTIGP